MLPYMKVLIHFHMSAVYKGVNMLPYVSSERTDHNSGIMPLNLLSETF